MSNGVDDQQLISSMRGLWVGRHHIGIPKSAQRASVSTAHFRVFKVGTCVNSRIFWVGSKDRQPTKPRCAFGAIDVSLCFPSSFALIPRTSEAAAQQRLSMRKSKTRYGYILLGGIGSCRRLVRAVACGKSAVSDCLQRRERPPRSSITSSAPSPIPSRVTARRYRSCVDFDRSLEAARV